MNQYQRLWWEQAACDYEAYDRMRRQGFAKCHKLQFLQMSTEKIAKAYFWRNGKAPPKTHAGFVQFLRFLATIPNERDRIAGLFAFRRFTDFQTWIYSVQPIAYALERITPDLANNGPNPEYPWPHSAPQFAPAKYDFEVWSQLENSNGRHLMRFIKVAIEKFPEYADT
ncbi:MAG: hypothetical protein RL240_3690 [Planctomycetota bacterium]|jgi:hypothetical protein